jgi:hypothetical protein
VVLELYSRLSSGVAVVSHWKITCILLVKSETNSCFLILVSLSLKKLNIHIIMEQHTIYVKIKQYPGTVNKCINSMFMP